MDEPQPSLDIDSFWEYSDPKASEARFRQALETATGDVRLELLTQIARSYGLRGDFDSAHQILDEVEAQLEGAGPRPRTSYCLERGRTLNSSGNPVAARQLFVEAWNRARSANIEGLAVDAAHMVAITYAEQEEAIDWNRRGLEIARQSQDPKARSLIPAMLNNGAWDLHGMGRYEEALALFEEARDEWVARGKTPQIQIAWWSVARCLRSLERFEEALQIQRRLEGEHAAEGSQDGYVYEEIAENLAALGQSQAARPYYVKAFQTLSQDDWLAKNESDRLKRLNELGNQ